MSSLVVMPRKAKKWDGLKIQPQRLVASWEAWVHGSHRRTPDTWISAGSGVTGPN